MQHEGDDHARPYPSPLMTSDLPRPLEGGGPLAGGQAERTQICGPILIGRTERPNILKRAEPVPNRRSKHMPAPPRCARYQRHSGGHDHTS